MYLNNINNYFQINERTQNIFIAHLCEFINKNIDLFTSFTMKDNTIWKEFKNNCIIYLGRTSCSKKISFDNYKLIENRYVQNLLKYKDNKEKNNIHNLINNIFNSIINKL